MVDILTRLGFIVKEVDKNITCITIPSFRKKDITIKEDIIEEIARMYGYSNIDPKPIKTILSKPKENELRNFERKTKDLMISNGFSEVLNYSFISEVDSDVYGLKEGSVVKLLNSLNTEQTLLKNTLIINLIKNIEGNLKYTQDVKIFEIGRVFNNDIESDKYENLPMQDYYFSACLTSANDKNNSFYKLKESLDKFLDLFKFEYEYKKEEINEIPKYCHIGRYANVFIGKEKVGYISELNPEISLKYKIKQKIAFFEIDFEKIFTFMTKDIIYKPISKFQKSEIDLSVVVDSNIPWNDIKKSILSVSKLIESVSVFDVYKGENINNNKVSLAFRMVFSNPEKNFNQEEIDSLWKNVYEKINKEFGAEIRK